MRRKIRPATLGWNVGVKPHTRNVGTNQPVPYKPEDQLDHVGDGKN